MELPPASDRIRLIRITPGNLRHSHIYVKSLAGFLPADCIGSAHKNANGQAKPIEIELDGLNQIIETDVGTDAKTGKPRGFLRERTWIGRFFKHHHVKAGDELELKLLNGRKYRL